MSDTFPPRLAPQQAHALKQHLERVGMALSAGDTARAAVLSDRAVSEGFVHPNLLTLAAHHQLTRGAPETALDYATRALAQQPTSAEALSVAARSCARLGRPAEALAAYDAALVHAPNDPTLHFGRGLMLEENGRVAAAREAYERVSELDPGHAPSRARLAALAAQGGDPKLARTHAEAALKLDPKSIVANIALARADLEEKHYDAAETRLVALAETGDTPHNRAIAQSMLADIFDARGEYERAFDAYAAAGNALKAAHAQFYTVPGAETPPQRVGRMTAFFETHGLGRLREPAAAAMPAPLRQHVFLVGFPRSGTTLLEQALAGHPEVQSTEETDCLIDFATEFLVDPDGLERLIQTQGEALTPWRETYWRRLGEGGIDLSRPVLIDKMPLNTVRLCLVAKLFPDAKILFALRDPRDVAFSCFRRRFGMTAQMYELNTLEGAANYYDAVMRLGELYRTGLGLDMHDVRYEDVVSDMPAALQHVCAFLGIDYDAAMQDFAARAQGRAINTPSAGQVTRELFASGIGQWRPYRKHIAPVLPLLAPWVARFGYPES